MVFPPPLKKNRPLLNIIELPFAAHDARYVGTPATLQTSKFVLKNKITLFEKQTLLNLHYLRPSPLRIKIRMIFFA